MKNVQKLFAIALMALLLSVRANALGPTMPPPPDCVELSQCLYDPAFTQVFWNTVAFYFRTFPTFFGF